MIVGRRNHGGRRWASRRGVVALACVTLLVTAAGCGDDDDVGAGSDRGRETTAADTTPEETTPETTPEETTSEETTPAETTSDGTTSNGTAPDETAAAPAPATTGQGTPVEVMLTDSSIDGLPTELTAGLVDVTVTDETEAAGGEINFTRVEPGTDQEAFVAGLVPVFEGGPFPDFFLNNAGVVGASTIALDEGEYLVWIDLASNLDRTSTAEDIITAPLTVGPAKTTRRSRTLTAPSPRVTTPSAPTSRPASRSSRSTTRAPTSSTT